MKKEISINDQLTDFIPYNDGNKGVKVEIYLHNETIWLPQKRMALLFGVDVSTINEHLKNIYKSDELDKKATIGNFLIIQKEGDREVKRQVNYYNLDAILSVGYRVNSYKATHH